MVSIYIVNDLWGFWTFIKIDLQFFCVVSIYPGHFGKNQYKSSHPTVVFLTIYLKEKNQSIFKPRLLTKMEVPRYVT